MPIVEPEILIEGGHDVATAAGVSARIISRCVAHLWQQVAPMCVASLPKTFMLRKLKFVAGALPLRGARLPQVVCCLLSSQHVLTLITEAMTKHLAGIGLSQHCLNTFA